MHRPPQPHRQPLRPGHLEAWGCGPAVTGIDWPWEPRLAWWPNGHPPQDRRGIPIGLVASRLPRALDTLPELFGLVRHIVQQAAASGDPLIVVPGTALAAILVRAARLWRATTWTAFVAPDRQSLTAWMRERRSESRTAPTADGWQVYVSPPLGPGTDAAAAEIRAADRVLWALARRLDVVRLLPNGNWDRLFAWFGGQNDRHPLPLLRFARGENLVSQRMAQRLRAMGGQPFPVGDWDKATAGHSRPSPAGTIESAAPGTVANPAGDYLIHSTRRCDGPWPGQDPDEYLDELLCDRAERDRSPLAVLRRILGEQRIRGSARAIRGGTPVVCLADVSLEDLPGRRIWRRHRRRWDFEPVGLAINRQWLIQTGARPVVYGDDQTWEQLSDVERPFFQRARSRASASPSAGRAALDWRDEREWRVVGDLSLQDVADDQVVVFVPSVREAESIRSVCRFPIHVVAESRADGDESTCRF